MVSIKGNKKDGFVITVYDKKQDFKDDIAITWEEAEELIILLNKFNSSKRIYK